MQDNIWGYLYSNIFFFLKRKKKDNLRTIKAFNLYNVISDKLGFEWPTDTQWHSLQISKLNLWCVSENQHLKFSVYMNYVIWAGYLLQHSWMIIWSSIFKPFQSACTIKKLQILLYTTRLLIQHEFPQLLLSGAIFVLGGGGMLAKKKKKQLFKVITD